MDVSFDSNVVVSVRSRRTCQRDRAATNQVVRCRRARVASATQRGARCDARGGRARPWPPPGRRRSSASAGGRAAAEQRAGERRRDERAAAPTVPAGLLGPAARVLAAAPHEVAGVRRREQERVLGRARRGAACGRRRYRRVGSVVRVPDAVPRVRSIAAGTSTDPAAGAAGPDSGPVVTVTAGGADGTGAGGADGGWPPEVPTGGTIDRAGTGDRIGDRGAGWVTGSTAPATGATTGAAASAIGATTGAIASVTGATTSTTGATTGATACDDRGDGLGDRAQPPGRRPAPPAPPTARPAPRPERPPAIDRGHRRATGATTGATDSATGATGAATAAARPAPRARPPASRPARRARPPAHDRSDGLGGLAGRPAW